MMAATRLVLLGVAVAMIANVMQTHEYTDRMRFLEELGSSQRRAAASGM